MIRYIAYTASAIALTAGITWLAMDESGLSRNTNARDLSVSSSTENQAPLRITDRSLAPMASKDENKDAAVDRRLQKLENQIRQLQQQLQAQRDEVAQIARASTAGHAFDQTAAQDLREQEPSEEEIARAEEVREQQRLMQLEGVFDSEQADHTWNQEAEQQIVSAAEQIVHDSADSGASLVDAQCRASLCRLELAANSLDAINNFGQMFPLHLGWQASIYQTIVHEPDGNVTSIIHVSKDGQDLPAEQGG